ncbi:hypothetical protein BFC17_00275 [Alteromonas lipolytica]|uniref:AttH domain-containing protein n=2 Tax=Alteromonas lipolytica TaxID=1856405 RepID=A0A1E8FK91_9ALTE|nr:hypothetical protein BFC17_00275 [Alteromonas lipolytica]
MSQDVGRQSLFNGLKADNNAQVSVDNPVQLPQDHAPHGAFQIEWWYLTLLLENLQGEPFNYQFTLFKFARPEMQSNWGDGYVWMGHSSLHTKQAHYFSEKFAQQGTGVAGFEASPLQFFMDNWQWQGEQAEQLLPATLTSSAQEADINLHLSASNPYVLHGDQGVSFKTADGRYRSYYYSQPFIEASGQIVVNGLEHQVKGIGWYDHEWTSQLADEEALGWDWFSLHFDDGRKLMAFTMHVDNGDSYTTGTLIDAQGKTVTLGPDELNLKALETRQVVAREIPVSWSLSIPSFDIAITTSPFKAEQWNASRFAYYEGAISFTGSHNGKGFMELTGY